MGRTGARQRRRGLGARRWHAAGLCRCCIGGAGGVLSRVGDVVKVAGTVRRTLVVRRGEILLKGVLDAAGSARVRVC